MRWGLGERRSGGSRGIRGVGDGLGLTGGRRMGSGGIMGGCLELEGNEMASQREVRWFALLAFRSIFSRLLCAASSSAL